MVKFGFGTQFPSESYSLQPHVEASLQGRSGSSENRVVNTLIEKVTDILSLQNSSTNESSVSPTGTDFGVVDPCASSSITPCKVCGTDWGGEGGISSNFEALQKGWNSLEPGSIAMLIFTYYFLFCFLRYLHFSLDRPDGQAFAEAFLLDKFLPQPRGLENVNVAAHGPPNGVQRGNIYGGGGPVQHVVGEGRQD